MDVDLIYNNIIAVSQASSSNSNLQVLKKKMAGKHGKNKASEAIFVEVDNTINANFIGEYRHFLLLIQL